MPSYPNKQIKQALCKIDFKAQKQNMGIQTAFLLKKTDKRIAVLNDSGISNLNFYIHFLILYFPLSNIAILYVLHYQHKFAS